MASPLVEIIKKNSCNIKPEIEIVREISVTYQYTKPQSKNSQGFEMSMEKPQKKRAHQVLYIDAALVYISWKFIFP